MLQILVLLKIFFNPRKSFLQLVDNCFSTFWSSHEGIANAISVDCVFFGCSVTTAVTCLYDIPSDFVEELIDPGFYLVILHDHGEVARSSQMIRSNATSAIARRMVWNSQYLWNVFWWSWASNEWCKCNVLRRKRLLVPRCLDYDEDARPFTGAYRARSRIYIMIIRLTPLDKTIKWTHRIECILQVAYSTDSPRSTNHHRPITFRLWFKLVCTLSVPKHYPYSTCHGRFFGDHYLRDPNSISGLGSNLAGAPRYCESRWQHHFGTHNHGS